MKTKLSYTVEQDGVGASENVDGDVEVEYHPHWKMEKVYVCPRNIAVHRGNPRACGRLCRTAQGEGEVEFVDEEVLEMVVVRKRRGFEGKVCLEG